LSRGGKPRSKAVLHPVLWPKQNDAGGLQRLRHAPSLHDARTFRYRRFTRLAKLSDAGQSFQ
jgi:hypothetical protein